MSLMQLYRVLGHLVRNTNLGWIVWGGIVLDYYAKVGYIPVEILA